MRRFIVMTALASLVALPLVSAQAPPAPVQKTKYVAPVRGTATIEVLQAPSKRDGKDMVTVIKVRNTSSGAINLLKADEYWYDAQQKVVSGSPYAHKKAPIQPGEIVEITLRSPYHPQARQNQILFSHANGKVDAKAVKAFK